MLARPGCDVTEAWKENMLARLRGDDVEDAQRALVELTLHGCPDPVWAETVCLDNSTHPDEGIRGNAVLGLGHLARTEGLSLEARVIETVQRALQDESAYVRRHAHSAADDIRQRHGWRVRPTMIEDDFFEGRRSRSMPLVINDPVEITDGENAGQAGAVIAIESFGADPILIIELGQTGQDVKVPLRSLRRILASGQQGAAADLVLPPFGRSEPGS